MILGPLQVSNWLEAARRTKRSDSPNDEGSRAGRLLGVQEEEEEQRRRLKRLRDSGTSQRRRNVRKMKENSVKSGRFSEPIGKVPCVTSLCATKAEIGRDDRARTQLVHRTRGCDSRISCHHTYHDSHESSVNTCLHPSYSYRGVSYNSSEILATCCPTPCTRPN